MCDSLVQLFQDAAQCPHSLLLLDDLEAIVQHCAACGGRFSSPRLHTLLAALGQHPPSGRVTCIVATTSLPEHTLAVLGLKSRWVGRSLVALRPLRVTPLLWMCGLGG